VLALAQTAASVDARGELWLSSRPLVAEVLIHAAPLADDERSAGHENQGGFSAGILARELRRRRREIKELGRAISITGS
jgi:hypothetical protein